MSSSNETIEGFIRFGRRTTGFIKFNDRTTIKNVYDHIYERFGHSLPKEHHIEFYSMEANKFLHLTEDIFTCKYNPFISNTTVNSQVTESIMDCVELFIVDDTPSVAQIDSQLNIPLNIVPSIESIRASIFQNPSNQDYSQNDIATNVTDTLEENLDTLINTVPSSGLSQALLSPLGYIQNATNQIISQNNVSLNDPDEEDNDNWMENTPAPTSIYQQTNSQSSTGSSNEYSLPTESTDSIHTHSDRTYFTHDVHPKQKDQYLTNKFKITDGSTTQKFKGGISFIQGFKTKEEIEKKVQVLPYIQIPLKYRQLGNANLVIYAVYEEEDNGMRIWYKHFDKGFLLHDQLKSNAEFINPIKLSLSKIPLNKNGEYKLKIYLITERAKQSNGKEEIYRLDEQTTIQIHAAKHIVSSTKKVIKPVRLLSVLEVNNKMYRNTVGLSNFVQSHEDNPQPILLNAAGIMQSISPPSKRRKV